MKDFKKEFIEMALAKNVLKFGEFELKSGRKSPYFFNAGLFNTGKDLAKLGRFYAAAIVDSEVDYDMIFGPAYKGIPIASATVTQMFNVYNKDIPWCCNRKEAKDHGEGGNLIGSSLKGNVLLVDDVITAGTAIRESMNIIKQNGANLVGVVVALDRQEKGKGEMSAIQEIERDFGTKVISIINLTDLIHYLEIQPNMSEQLKMVSEYRLKYGV